jgi:hypothetical protein
VTAYALTTPSRTGALITAAAVSTSDTLARSVIGSKGVNLKIINGNAATNTVTISDASTTAEGAPAAAISVAVSPSTSRVFRVMPAQCDPVTGNVTITNTVTTTVTYEVTPRG